MKWGEKILYSKERTKFIRKRSFYGDGWWTCKCVVCGDMFDSNQSYAKYCSNACKQKAYRARKANAPTASEKKAEEYRSKGNIEREAISQTERAARYANMIKGL